MNPDILKQKINSLHQVWNSQTKEYINTYPEKQKIWFKHNIK